MPQFISKWKCQTRDDSGHIITHPQGDIIEFDEVPDTNWILLEDAVEDIDFGSADKKLLKAAKFKFSDLASFCQKRYGEDLPELSSKVKIIDRFLDIRYRSADVPKV